MGTTWKLNDKRRIKCQLNIIKEKADGGDYPDLRVL